MSCPICNKPTEAAHRPFCSKRCADVDLGRWLGGGYAIPSTDPEDIEAALDAAARVAEAERTKPN
ncbi:DNA gyrase inhibitor YacG [Roseovarius arcticus]|uniref:DNA gyrase inhibitor YacG n=1 Tax=Roseovarius arcticus TaxID=2547404 RepID=UPI001110E53A|nr:DNA gyrase inhibitor YacG [Roseovarius arcticus]